MVLALASVPQLMLRGEKLGVQLYRLEANIPAENGLIRLEVAGRYRRRYSGGYSVL